jgi:hypothetical protein
VEEGQEAEVDEMAAIKKTDVEVMNEAQRKTKIAELERAILELRGEGRPDKVKPLRKAIAMLMTPQTVKKK